jgi:hypothetical protein
VAISKFYACEHAMHVREHDSIPPKGRRSA